MLRKIVTIDREKCNGCGLCAQACHEGAIGMVDGKAALLRDDYCDGMGDCLPACPVGAIAFEEREAAAYDAKAVDKRKAQTAAPAKAGCQGSHPDDRPGTGALSIRRPPRADASEQDGRPAPPPASELSQWPVQIKLAPVKAPYFDGARLLVAATCTAYARADFHERFIRGRAVLVGCPKLDGADYAEKLGAILAENDIRSVTLVRMDVPCCGGLEDMLKRALAACGRQMPWRIATVARDGQIEES